MTNTGSTKLCGSLFIGATNYDKKFRAFDKSTDALLWETIGFGVRGNFVKSSARMVFETCFVETIWFDLRLNQYVQLTEQLQSPECCG
jgi:hypothetical protein